MARASSHLALVCSLLLPPAEVDPHSHSKQELSLLPLGYQFDHFYQLVADWWEKEVLSSQPSSFPSGPSPNFSCWHPAAGTLSEVGEFASAPSLSKSATLSRLKAPSSESIKSDYSAHCKVAIMASVQNLLLFLLDPVEAFIKDPRLSSRTRLCTIQEEFVVLPPPPLWCSTGPLIFAAGRTGLSMSCVGEALL